MESDMHKRVVDELSLRITNLNLHTERDKSIFDEIYEKSGAKKCVEQSVRLIGMHEDLSRYTREQLEEKYHGVLANFVDTRAEAVQFMTLLATLDLKLSHVIAMLEEEAGKYPLKLGELRELAYTAGFSSTHKFYKVSGAPQEEKQAPVKVEKVKGDRGKLRLIK